VLRAAGRPGRVAARRRPGGDGCRRADVVGDDSPRCWPSCARTSIAAGDASTLGDALRVRGVEPAQQWGQTAEGDGVNRRGVTREQIAAAITASGPPARSSGSASGESAT
jgi:hypothetical protein